MPVTIPVAEPTEPTASVLLDHVPPVVADDKVTVDPTHTDTGPMILPDTDGTTVTTIVTAQPATR
jgi:hypothetical protein